MLDISARPAEILGQRVVVLDTETTGFDPGRGDRVVEVACVELINLVPTGRELHFYCNPERDMPEDAFAVHGLSRAFLSDHPRFDEQAPRLLAFLDGAEGVVAHNAEFDFRFLNAELELCGLAPLELTPIDTLQLARRKFPGAPASLDALCRRFAIDLSERIRHGALIDTRLLGRVYLELMGGQQPDLALSIALPSAGNVALPGSIQSSRLPMPHAATPAELALHAAMLERLKDPVWLAE